MNLNSYPIFEYFSSALRSKNIQKLKSIFIFLAILPVWQPLPQASWQAKVDPWLLARLGPEPLEFLVYLHAQADLSGAARLADKTAKGEYVYQRLTETARRSQAPLLSALAQRGLAYRPYWIANFIWVRGDLAALQFIASRPEVAYIYPNPSIRLDLPVSQRPVSPFPRPPLPSPRIGRRKGGQGGWMRAPPPPSSGTSNRSTPPWSGPPGRPARASSSPARTPATSGITRRSRTNIAAGMARPPTTTTAGTTPSTPLPQRRV